MRADENSRVFLGCVEIANMMFSYDLYLKSKDYKVTSFNKSFYGLNDHIYTFQTGRVGDNFLPKKLPGRELMIKLFTKVYLKSKVIRRLKARQIIKNHDVFIFFWATESILNNYEDLKKIREKGKKIVYMFLGSDVRYIPAFEIFIGKSMYSEWGHQDRYKLKLDDNLTTLRQVEYYSDAIFSVPDQSLTAIKPYYHLYLPIALHNLNFQYKRPKNRLLIVHLPSNPSRKGTETVLKVIEKLKLDGLQFDFIYKTNIKNQDIKNILSKSHVLIDELNGLGPGMLSLEAMALGNVVLTRFEKTQFNNPPIIPITHQNLEEQIRKLLELEFNVLNKIACQNREYVENKHEIGSCLRQIFDAANNDIEPDYYPDFLKDNWSELKDFVNDKNLELSLKILKTDKFSAEERKKKWLNILKNN